MNRVPSRLASARRSIKLGMFALVIWASGIGSTVRAGIAFVDTFRNVSFRQTGNGNMLSTNGSFFSADLTSTGANDYNSVQMVYPGPGSPLAIPQQDPTTFHAQTSAFASQAAMDAAFPTGTYTFNASKGATTDTTSFLYSADDYPKLLPYLTGTNYSDLQGMNPSKPFTFLMSPYDTGGTAKFSFIFLTIFDYDKNAFVFDAGFLPATTTSVALPANTLAPGHHFAYELDYSNRDLVASPGAVFQAQLGFDVRTTGLFATAAVPEPSSAILAGIGAGTLIVMGHVRRRRDAATA